MEMKRMRGVKFELDEGVGCSNNEIVMVKGR